MNCTKYLWEMYQIANAGEDDLGVGRDKFWANLNNAGMEGAEHYPGAEHLDWAALGARWKAMGEEEQWREKILCGDICRGHWPELAGHWRNGDRAAFDAAVAALDERYRTPEEA